MPRSSTAEMAALRSEVFNRAGFRCEFPYCNAPATELAHIQHRGMGGSRERNNPANAFAACHNHHEVFDGRTSLGTLRWELAEMMREHIRKGGNR